MPIYSYNRYVSTGTQPFSITFDYLSKDHIEVYLDNVLQTSGYTIDTSTNQLTFTSVPGSGVVVLIKRVTPKSKTDFQSQIADFQDGSVLTESDLDTAALGLLYISQEAEDSATTDAMRMDQLDEQWDGESKRIKRVNSPSSETDAATKGYVDGLSLYPGVPSIPQTWVLSGDASATTFTLDSTSGSGDPAATDVNTFIVDVAGVLQKPTTDFTLSSTSITFTTAPASGTNNVTVRNFGVAKDTLFQPVKPSLVGDVGLTVQGLSGQTANLVEAKDSSGTKLTSIDPDGNILVGDYNSDGSTAGAGVNVAGTGDARHGQLAMSAKTGATTTDRAIRIDMGGTNPEFAVRNDGQVDVGLWDSTSTTDSGVIIKNASNEQGQVSIQAKSSATSTNPAFSVYHGSTAGATLDYGGNLDLIAGVLKVGGNTCMTIRQIITTATYDTSQNESGEDYCQTDTTAKKASGISVSITTQSASSKVILIAQPRLDSYQGAASTGYYAGIYRGSTALTAKATPSGGTEITPSGDTLGLFSRIVGNTSTEIDATSVWGTGMGIFIDSPGSAGTFVYDIIAGLYGTTGSGEFLRHYTTSNYSQFYAIEIA